MADGFPGYPRGGVGTDPLPSPWTAVATLQWEGAAQANGSSVVNGRFAVWSTNTFDLRPEYGLGAAQFNPATQGAVKVYNSQSKQLVVQVTLHSPPGANPAPAIDTFLQGLNISCWDEANPWNPQDMRVVTPEQDVTSRFTAASELKGRGPVTVAQGISGLGFFAPPSGPAGTVRFWRFNMIFRFHLQQPFDPQVSVTAGYY